MTISVYSRHSLDCPKRDDSHWRRCRCPKWLYSIDWKPVPQRSAKTRSWDEAERRARQLEAGEFVATTITVRKAVESYLSDLEERSLSGDYRKKVKRELDSLAAWCEKKPVRSLPELALSHLGEYRATWNGNASTRYKRQERLRSFFLYCQRHEWISDNPAKRLSKIKTEQRQVIPLTKEQYAKCLEHATDRTRTMLKLLRWSGLRITDAATLERKRLQGDNLYLYTQKTKTHIYVPLPPSVARELRELQGSNPLYFFWSGKSLKKSAGIRWWENLKLAFRAAGISDAHPHQLRHTFAVELLLSGVSIEDVSKLLGHSSIRITERYYAAWMPTRQAKMESAVRSSWSDDLDAPE